MALIESHRKSLRDPAFQAEKLSPDMAKLRGDHLAALAPLEEMIRAKSPLPVSYDAMRLQPPFFFEFTYTEMLGCMWVTPQSSELAARVVQSAMNAPTRRAAFRPSDHLPLRDKYKLGATGDRPRKVAFVPGANMFDQAVSPEILLRLMHEDRDVVIKPHPMSGEELIRKLGRAVGYHRVLEPGVSGAGLIHGGLEMAYVTASTEMGLYAVLHGVRISNLTRYPFEPRATYTPFYRLLWGAQPMPAREQLRTLIDSPLSGFFHPEDPDLEPKMELYFENAMRLRSVFEPAVMEILPEQWADMVTGRLAPRKEAANVPMG